MIYKTLHSNLKIKKCEHINGQMTKDKQWSTKHYTATWRLNNANTSMAKWLKTNNDLQSTAQNPED